MLRGGKLDQPAVPCHKTCAGRHQGARGKIMESDARLSPLPESPDGWVLPVGDADPGRRRPLAHHALMLGRMAVARLLARGQGGPELAEPLRRLRRYGLVVFENFLPAEACAALRQASDALLRRHAGQIRVDRWDADHRLFVRPDLPGVLGEIARHQGLRALATAALRGPVVNAGLLVARLEAKPGNPGSGAGWHRDSFVSQVKTLLYLDDVDEENGPFQYVMGSQRLGAKLGDRRRARIGWRQRRLPDEAVERLLAAEPERLRTVTGRAGTLVLADTTGIHRGMPIRRGQRHALTNYFYPRWQVDAALLAHLRPMLVPAAEGPGA